MDLVAKSQKLQKDINSFKALSLGDPQKQVDTFLQTYDVNDAKFVRGNSQYFDSDFLESVSSVYDSITPESFLLMIHYFCLLDKEQVVDVFLETGAYSLIQTTLNECIEDEKIVELAAKTLCFIVQGNEEISLLISDDMFIELLIDATAHHRKNERVLLPLLILITNTLYGVKSAKDKFIEHGGLKILLDTIPANIRNEKLVYSSFGLLRNISYDCETISQLQEENKINILKEIFLVMRENKLNDKIQTNGLWIALNLIERSEKNKQAFVDQRGNDILVHNMKTLYSVSELMEVCCLIIERIASLAKFRALLGDIDMIEYLSIVLRNQKASPDTAYACLKAFYRLSFNDDNRFSIGMHGAIPEIISCLKSTKPKKNIHLIAGHLLYKLTFDDVNREILITSNSLQIFVSSQNTFSSSMKVMDIMTKLIRRLLTNTSGGLIADNKDDSNVVERHESELIDLKENIEKVIGELESPEFENNQQLDTIGAEIDNHEEQNRFEVERLEAERLAKEEAERAEAERLDKEEAERLAKDEAERVETEKIAKEEAERLEAERLAKEEAERVEAERLAKEEEERKAKEEAERLEAERLAKEEAERKAKEEADRLETERLAKEEAERLAKEEAKRAEAERLAKEEAERLEAKRLAKEEEERKAKEEAERLEAERLAKEEAERKAKEEIERFEAERFARKEKETIGTIGFEVKNANADKQSTSNILKNQSSLIVLLLIVAAIALVNVF